jgi:DNA-binding NtrC family response regulator
MVEQTQGPKLSSVEPHVSADAAISPPPSVWIAGSSTSMTQLRGQVHRVAPYFRTALLLGERNSGEEAAARILHQLSPLSHRPFALLTPATAEHLLSSPAGSGTSEDAAAQGMIYLPRPERLPAHAQTALLHLLRRHSSQVPRIVVFAERGLRPLVSAGSFSADLAEALGALRISLPPLRERKEDIPALLAYLLQDAAAPAGITPPQLAPDLIDAARKLAWPGNLTQLHAVATGLLDHADKRILHAPDLTEALDQIPQAVLHDRRQVRMMRLDDIIQEHIRAVLFACNGNKLRTAEVLGISRSTLYRMLDAQLRPTAEPLTAADLRMIG